MHNCIMASKFSFGQHTVRRPQLVPCVLLECLAVGTRRPSLNQPPISSSPLVLVGGHSRPSEASVPHHWSDPSHGRDEIHGRSLGYQAEKITNEAEASNDASSLLEDPQSLFSELNIL